MRGAVEGWDFKNYILGFLFYRFISENFCKFIAKEMNAGEDFDYSTRNDNEEWIEEMKHNIISQKGYFIYPSQLFSSVFKAINEDGEDMANLNERISNIFNEIEKTATAMNDEGDAERSGNNFKGLLTSVDLSDTRIGTDVSKRNARIKKIMQEIGAIHFPPEESDSDIFGDAYEYLIGMFAANAGKAGGEFYTPPEVSELMVQIASCEGQKIKKIYDPTCGSGSLLLKFKKVYDNIDDLEFYGQEINLTACNMCKMNMFLHRLDYHKFMIEHGNTLTNDLFAGHQFDVVVSNPPFSVHWDGKDDPLLLKDERFAQAGALAPKSKADLAFVQHSVYHLNNRGVAAIVCFPGVLYREGPEKKIRKWLVEQNYVDAIIQLADNLFYGVGISVCIMILKNNTKKEPNVLFIDATDKFIKAKNRNRLDENNIGEILEIYKRREDMESHSKLVTRQEIEEKDYNLSVATYVVREEQEEETNIDELNESLRKTSAKVNKLREQIEELIKNF